MSIQPPLSNLARPTGDLTCGRLTSDPGGHCPKTADWHVLWTADGDNTLCCAEHMTEAENNWVWFSRHPIGALCTALPAVFEDDGCHADIADDNGSQS